MLAIRAAGGPYAVLGLHWDFGSRMCCVTSVFLWNEISLPRLPLPGSGWGTMGPKLQKDIILSPTRQSPICWTEGASSGRHTGVNLRPWKDRRTGQAGSSTKAPRPFERPSSSSQSDHDILANPKALSLQGDVVWPSLLPPWPLYYVYIYAYDTNSGRNKKWCEWNNARNKYIYRVYIESYNIRYIYLYRERESERERVRERERERERETNRHSKRPQKH